LDKPKSSSSLLRFKTFLDFKNFIEQYKLGLVLYGRYPFNQDKNHYLFILNVVDDIAYFLVATSKVDNVLQWARGAGELSSVVVLDPNSLTFLTQKTALNCGKIQKITIRELFEKGVNEVKGNVLKHGYIILNILLGVLNSETAKPYLKEKVILPYCHLFCNSQENSVLIKKFCKVCKNNSWIR